MNAILQKLLEVLFPSNVTCAICSNEARLDERGICAECAGKLIQASLFAPPEHVDACRAVFVYDDPVSHVVYALKYHGKSYQARFMARCMDIPKSWPVDLLLPVPLYTSREKQRGYNQAWLICKEISDRNKIPAASDILLRIRNTPSQTSLSAEQRKENLTGAFSVKEPHLITQKQVLLIDDVQTTGSTLSECAKVLKISGAAGVRALTFCR